jgi:hypothetical protein
VTLGRIALVALVSPACASLDVGLADGGIDGGPDAVGLHLRLHASPDAGAAVGGPFAATLGEGELGLEDVRAIGDAAPGDDDRTRADRYDLRWPDDDPTREIGFEAAPAGTYSTILATIVRYRIAGTAVVDGMTRALEIADDDAALTISIALSDVVLLPGDRATIDLVAEVGDVVADVAWDDVALEADTLALGPDDPQAAAVAAALAASFSAVPPP